MVKFSRPIGEKIMKKSFAWLALGMTLLTVKFLAEAQQAKKIFRIGYLENARPDSGSNLKDPFFLGLRELGWIESQNIVIERRYWENRREQLPALVDELIRLKVDLIVTTTGMGALVAKKTTTIIPIVMTGSADAVALGLVDSLARPGGNVTGITGLSPGVIGRRLELLKVAFPKVTRVAVLTCPREGLEHGSTRQWTAAVQGTAPLLKLDPQFFDIRGPEYLVDGFQAAMRKRADALFVMPCPLIPSSETVDLAIKSRLPAMFADRRFVEFGGLMMYGPKRADTSRQAAVYVDNILRGAKPADLPVQQPIKFELVINLKTAKLIDVTIPPEVLFWADEVIE
jgi:putative ABC transport system substrate-binding protein